MTGARDSRRCALQALYQFDAVRLTSEPTEEALDLVRETLGETASRPDVREEGFRLAFSAWQSRESADELIAPLTPEWPLHRQPAVDRSILRLAYFELSQTRSPAKVIITEAIELAREFSTEKSPAFVNGVLDQLTRQLRPDEFATLEPIVIVDGTGPAATGADAAGADAVDVASSEVAGSEVAGSEVAGSEARD